MSRSLIASVCFTAAFVSAVASGGVALGQWQFVSEGVITDWEPRIMKMQIANGGFTASAFIQPPLYNVTAIGKVEELPASVPCFLTGRVLTQSKSIASGADVRVVVPMPDANPAVQPQATAVASSTDVELQSVPGILRTGSPPTFLVGPGVNLVGGKSYTLPETFVVEYYFGSNISMAGARPKGRIFFNPMTPDRLRVDVERTEALDTTQLFGKKAKPKAKKP